MAAKVTVDNVNKLLIAKSGVTELDVQVDLYSDLKEDWLANANGELGYDFPFYESVGGNFLATGKILSPFFFLKTGWRIRPDEVDHELLLVGNLYSGEEPAEPLTTATVGAYTVMVIINRAFDSMTVQAGSGLDAQQDARLILIERLLRNRMVTDPGTGVLTLYADDDVTPLVVAQLWEDIAQTQKYRGQGAEERERLT
jgi:hypothetical protein